MLRLVSLGLMVGLVWAESLVCPENHWCKCVLESEHKFRMTCSTNGSAVSPFMLTFERTPSYDGSWNELLIECTGEANWSEFLPDSNFQLGSVQRLEFRSCKPPGELHSSRVAKNLGLHDVTRLTFSGINGTLSRHDFVPYPNLDILSISDMDLSNVTNDLIADLLKLETLKLRNTTIHLRSGFFDKASKMSMIIFEDNHLIDIEPDTFQNLTNIDYLILRGNNIRILPPPIFDSLENMKTLYLDSNNITSLPEGLFKRNLALNHVQINGNLPELPRGLFANLTNLSWVSLWGTGLFSLPEDLFWGTTHLKDLRITGNNLQSLPPRIFYNTSNLENLHLSSNELNYLPDYIFENTTNLRKLVLSKNHLTSINDKLLVGLEQLNYLIMTDNHLSFIHINAFSSLSKLRIADFDNNQLSMPNVPLDLRPFNHCHLLTKLYLAHNNITKMPWDWVTNKTSLRMIDLQYNSFNYLQIDEIFVRRDIDIDLRHNNISRIILPRLEMNQTKSSKVSIKLADNPIHCDCEMYDRLRSLGNNIYADNNVQLVLGDSTCNNTDYMSDHQAQELGAETLVCRVKSRPCSSMGECDCWYRPKDKTLVLDCAQRNLSYAPESIYSFPAAKVELDLSGNQLHELPYMTNTTFDHLTSLNLSNNHIASIDEILLPPNLETLILDGNNLTSIDSETLNRLSYSSISKLSLANNPFVCDCSARQLLSFVQYNLPSLPELRELTCGTSGQHLYSLSVYDLCNTSSSSKSR